MRVLRRIDAQVAEIILGEDIEMQETPEEEMGPGALEHSYLRHSRR